MWRAGRRNASRVFRTGIHRIAILMQGHTWWTHSDVWSQLAPIPVGSFKIGDRQSEKTQCNSDQRVICHATRGIDTGRSLISHWGVSYCSDGTRPLWRSCSAWTEMFITDAGISRISSLNALSLSGSGYSTRSLISIGRNVSLMNQKLRESTQELSGLSSLWTLVLGKPNEKHP